MATILITGANRGIGLELARQYAANGDDVIACCREPDRAAELAALGDRVSRHRLDVTNADDLARLRDDVGDRAIDVLLLNAGVFLDREQSFGDVDPEAWLETFRVNTIAPLLCAQAFADAVARSERKTIALITSQLGSIANNTGGYYAYRSSKAALNMVGSNLAIDLAPRGITCVLLHPGWVRTAMGGDEAPVTPSDSAAGIRRVLDELSPADHARYLTYDGEALPW